MALSVAAGRILDHGEGGFRDGDTWSDGTAGGLEAGAFTFEASLGAATDRAGVLAALDRAREAAAASAPAADGAAPPQRPPAAPLVDAFWLVSEEQIRVGMLAVLEGHTKVLEGAAATAVGAAVELAALGALRGCTVVMLCCGGNVAMEKVRTLLAAAPGGEFPSSPAAT